MKKILIGQCTLFAVLFLFIFSCSAQVDPILLNIPHENVFGCNEIFIELMEKPVIGKNTGGRNAIDNFLYFKTEILFLEEKSWDGFDKNSFTVYHVEEDGTKEFYPLDFAMTTMTNHRNGWNNIYETMEYTYLNTTNLVFDIVPTSREDWFFLFRPMERGKTQPYCEIEIPLTIK